MEKTLFPMHGIVTTVTTPFDDNKDIIWNDLRKTVKAGLDAGLAGFLVPCFASEMDYLTIDERYQMTEEVVKITKEAGHGIVLPNIRGKSKEDCVEQAKEYLKMGVSGVNIFMPKTSEEEYEEIVAAVDAIHPPFLCLQDTKDTELGARFVKHLFDKYESFRCIKIETVNPGKDYTEIIKATENKLNVSGSWGSDQMIEAYDRGIHALMPSGMFEQFVNTFSLYHEKGRDAAMKLFYDMLPIIVWTRQSDDVNLYFHKSYFKRFGLYECVNFRGPFKVDDIHKSYAEEMIDRALWIREHIADYWK